MNAEQYELGPLAPSRETVREWTHVRGVRVLPIVGTPSVRFEDGRAFQVPGPSRWRARGAWDKVRVSVPAGLALVEIATDERAAAELGETWSLPAPSEPRVLFDSGIVAGTDLVEASVDIRGVAGVVLTGWHTGTAARQVQFALRLLDGSTMNSAGALSNGPNLAAGGAVTPIYIAQAMTAAGPPVIFVRSAPAADGQSRILALGR